MVLCQGTERHRSDWMFREVRAVSCRWTSAARSREKPGTLGWSETIGAGGRTAHRTGNRWAYRTHKIFQFFLETYRSKCKLGESEIAVQRPLFVSFPQFCKRQSIHFKCKSVCVTMA